MTADVAPGNDQLSIGDTVEIEVLGADCAQGAHYGYVYIDSFGTARLPGLTVLKNADKAIIAPRERPTYSLNYRNSGSTAVSNVVVSETLPAQTVFVSASAGSDVYVLNDQLWKSTDAGATWSVVPDVPVSECGAVALQSAPAPTTVWVGCHPELQRQ